MTSSLVLTQSAGVRYATGSLMYFAQGIPQGLLGIALPAWLASEGASGGDIGSYLAIIALPWAFKYSLELPLWPSAVTVTDENSDVPTRVIK